MRNELKILGFLMGLSVALAQDDGSRAIGVYVSKEGIRAVNARFMVGGDFSRVGMTVMGGLFGRGGYMAGVSVQTLFEVGGGCSGGVCYRRSVVVSPYLDAGMRFAYRPEGGSSDLLGHIGGGLLVPISVIELFGEVALQKPLTAEGIRFDVGGGIRIRF